MGKIERIGTDGNVKEVLAQGVITVYGDGSVNVSGNLLKITPLILLDVFSRAMNAVFNCFLHRVVKGERFL